MTLRECSAARLGVLFGATLVGATLFAACGGNSKVDRASGGAGGTPVAQGGDAGQSAGTRNEAGHDSEGGAPTNGGTSSGGTSGIAGMPPRAGTGGGAQAGLGASAGAGGDAGEGTGGTGGGAGAPPVTCNSSDGSGCEAGWFCLDEANDDCFPTLEETRTCAGVCVARAAPARCGGLGATTPCPEGYACVPDAETAFGTDPASICVQSATDCSSDADCSSGFTCVPHAGGSVCTPALVACSGAVCDSVPPPECPPGFSRSMPDGCYGPCVPTERCGCDSDWECGVAPFVCDLTAGRCATPRAPAPRCLLPLEPGTCEEGWQHWAFVEGGCQPVEGVRCDKDNAFDTREACWAHCEGRPGQEPCTEGTQPAVTCLQCGAGGGCALLANACLKLCNVQEDCGDTSSQCFEGLCHFGLCF